jgi:hypothetical protein
VLLRLTVALLLLLQVRLTFKPESQQLWIASNTTTQKREFKTGFCSVGCIALYSCTASAAAMLALVVTHMHLSPNCYLHCRARNTIRPCVQLQITPRLVHTLLHCCNALAVLLLRPPLLPPPLLLLLLLQCRTAV